MARIPLRLEPDPDDPACGNWVIDGSIAGVPRTFLLDSGAPRTTVTADAVTASWVAGASGRNAGAFGVSEAEEAVIIPELRLGSLIMTNLHAVRTVLIEGLIRDLLGMDVLGRHRWLLSTRNLTLEICAEVGATHPLTIGATGHPYLEVDAEGATAFAQWDTGAGITLVSQEFLDAHPASFTELGLSTGIDATGATASTMSYQMCATTIGGVRFEPCKVAVVDLAAVNARLPRAMDLILGYPTISQADWVVDFPAGRFEVIPH